MVNSGHNAFRVAKQLFNWFTWISPIPKINPVYFYTSHNAATNWVVTYRDSSSSTRKFSSLLGKLYVKWHFNELNFFWISLNNFCCFFSVFFFFLQIFLSIRLFSDTVTDTIKMCRLVKLLQFKCLKCYHSENPAASSPGGWCLRLQHASLGKCSSVLSPSRRPSARLAGAPWSEPMCQVSWSFPPAAVCRPQLLVPSCVIAAPPAPHPAPRRFSLSVWPPLHLSLHHVHPNSSQCPAPSSHASSRRARHQDSSTCS